jgi:hypothetical protein
VDFFVLSSWIINEFENTSKLQFVDTSELLLMPVLKRKLGLQPNFICIWLIYMRYNTMLRYTRLNVWQVIGPDAIYINDLNAVLHGQHKIMADYRLRSMFQVKFGFVTKDRNIEPWVNTFAIAFIGDSSDHKSKQWICISLFNILIYFETPIPIGGITLTY